MWKYIKYDDEREKLNIKLRNKDILENIDIIKAIRIKDLTILECIYKFIKRIKKVI